MLTIRGVLMGKDDGNDVLVHFSDYTQNIMDDRKERFSGYRR
jgi:cold shock CspA family protein